MQNQENIKQRCWHISLGHEPIPQHWYDNDAISNQQEANKSFKQRSRRSNKIKVLSKDRALAMMRRGSLALFKNGKIKSRREIYSILKDRGFLIKSGYNEIMVESTFYRYCNKWNIYCTDVAPDFRKKFILDNYLTMTVNEIAQKIDCSISHVYKCAQKIKKENQKCQQN